MRKFIPHARIGGMSVVLVVREKQEYRLSGTCFRGSECRCAGNFFTWKNCDHLFSNTSIKDSILADAQVAYIHDCKQNSFYIDFGRDIGWSSTDSAHKYTPGDLDDFHLSRLAQGKRIKTTRTDLKAPRTTLVTIVYELKIERDPEIPARSQVIIVVHTVYPGPDIGDLRGDVSDREGCVFFDWNHPGE